MRRHFGLGNTSRIDEVAVRWPDGHTESVHDLSADRFVALRHGQGLVGQHGSGYGNEI
jgi:hypothetical protein